jgi:uncharacterized protein (TIGR03435 family)
MLVPVMGRLVLDRTGEVGEFDIDVVFSPADSLVGNGPAAVFDRAAFIAALRDQLGLELQETTATVDMLVIDAAEKPPEQ